MSLSHETQYSDEQLVRYLLQLLPEGDIERIDELSIADEEMAWRLRVVEDDLVDAYVSGRLAGETVRQFEELYLTSEHRRRKVEFAQRFLQKVDQEATKTRPARSHAWKLPRATAQWSLAVAAALLLMCGALMVRDARLRNVLSEAQGQSAVLERRARELEQQLNDQRAANAETVRELERVRALITELQVASLRPDRPNGPAQTLGVIAILLLPQTRAVGQVPTVTIPRGSTQVTFELQLESNRASQYQAAVKDPSSNAIVWRTGRLAAASSGDRPAVSVAIPVSILKAQHYAIDLMGDGAEVVGTYAVRIAFR